MAKKAEPKGPTAEQIARYGHVSAAIREAMATKGWNPGDFNVVLGKPRGAPSIYSWLKGTGAPEKPSRAQIAKVLGIPPEALEPRDLSGPTIAKNRSLAIRPPQPAQAVQPNIIGFTVSSDGIAKVKLDVSCTPMQAMQLTQFMMSIGIGIKR